MSTDAPLALSVVVPAHDEEGNILLLAKALGEALDGIEYEVLLVDDDSRDGTGREMLEARAANPRLRVLRKSGTKGKTSSLLAGFDQARGAVIATIDADLQDDPKDIVRCLDALEPGVHGVNGWRQKRDDTFIKRLSSKIGNGVRRWALGGTTQDAGTGVRVFRRECLHVWFPFEGMHRYFGELMQMHGYEVKEIPVSHHRRHAGVAKYGVGNRAFRGIADVMAMRWTQRRLARYQTEELDS